MREHIVCTLHTVWMKHFADSVVRKLHVGESDDDEIGTISMMMTPTTATPI